MHRIFLGLILGVLLSGLWNCASQTTPMGGPKDTIPPKLISSTPAQNEKNFDGSSVELTFDELITLSNPKEEILISPSIGKDVEFKPKKNSITITPKHKWHDSTTYTISLREGIKDLTEGNPPPNLRLAFSTGPFIDSLSITGKVRLALKEKVPEKITVAIFESDTFNIFEHTPSYFTVTNKKGQFSLENLRNGNYRIYAFEDKNKNLKVESVSEKFGFLSQEIFLDRNVDSLTLYLISLDTRQPRLNNFRNNGFYTRFAFSKALNSYSLIAETEEKPIHSYGSAQSEIIMYNPTEILDSLRVTLTAIDSVDQRIDTVVYVKPATANFLKDPFGLNPDRLSYNLATNVLTQKFKLSKPLQEIHLDSIFIKPDSAVFIPFTIDEFHYDSITKLLTVEKKIRRDSLFRNPKFTTEFLMGAGSIISIESDSNKTYIAPIPNTDPDKTGTLLIEAQTNEPFYIIQLTNANNDLIEEVSNPTKYSFQYLTPQNYKIRMIIDTNNNGKWDPGNIYKNQEPEKILFYQTLEKKYEIPIRANWELGPLMLIF